MSPEGPPETPQAPRENPQLPRDETHTPPEQDASDDEHGEQAAKPEIIARYPDHVWHVDLTVVPILFGMALRFLPFSMPQCWPWAWYTLAVVDHYSRRCMGLVAFAKRPSSEDVQQALARIIKETGTPPRYIICDRDSIFDCQAFREWCEDADIQPPRYGKQHEHGSIAVVERFIKTLKDSWTRRVLVPFHRARFEALLQLFARWYNEHRPHERFFNKLTPQDVYDMTRAPACLARRTEPRTHPSCAKDKSRPPIRGTPGVQLDLGIRFLDEDAGLGTRLLPVVTLQEKNAA